MSAASDDTLLAGFALGDADAAAAFIRRYQGRVYGLARSMVADADLAEDVAQEAFLRAWRNAGAYDSRRGSVHTWMLVITRNLAIDTLPAEQRQALLLAGLCGRTAAEISEIESIPLGTAKTRIRTGLAKVRAAMAGRSSEQ